MTFKKLIPKILFLTLLCIIVLFDQTKKEQNKEIINVVEDKEIIDIVEGKPLRVLTISSFTESSYLREYADEFQRLNPDTLIQFEIFNEGITEVISEGEPYEREISDDKDIPTEFNDNITVLDEGAMKISISISRNNPSEDLQPDKYVSKINTDLMKGQGSDILDLSGLPSSKYADSNYLVELYELFENDTDIILEEYYTNVFEAYEYKDKLYQIPLNFQYNYCGINKEYISANFINNKNYWNYDMIFSIYDKIQAENAGIFDSSLFDNYSWTGLFEHEYATLFNVSDKTCNINTDIFLNMLKSSVALFPEDFEPDIEEFRINVKKDKKDKLFINLYYPSGIFGYDYKDKFDYIQPLLNADGNIVLLSTNRLSINKNSEEKELAWEFIKFCLNNQIQKSSYRQSVYPVKKSIFEENFFHNNYMNKELFAEINKWNESEFSVNFSDGVIDKIFKEELINYFLGSQTAEQTAENLQNKVSTYLNE